ncbi:MAG: hypothetical protein EA381_02500 [Planctomycetaceae bacterium]|nr:MAG: hypothetical protein EA381_02500 [Planctomycetaceae bacterium]
MMPPLWLLPIGLLLVIGLVPGDWANRRALLVRTWVPRLVAALCLITLATGISGPTGWGALRSGGADAAQTWRPAGIDWGGPEQGVAWLMLLLVSFLGWVVARYSVRQLDGDPDQGRFFSRLSLTLAGVATLVATGNLLVMWIAWVLAGWGLQGLLLHHRNCEQARTGARLNRVASGLGDVALLAAVVLAFREFGTLNFSELFAELSARRQLSGSGGALAEPIAWLLITGCAIKATQFPFHFWLPETLNAPASVSALMHAGIVNAGGYVLVRCGPLVVEAPVAMGLLAVIGTVTALFAGLVMLSQPSVKHTLAYSTIAQMGFMMMQIGIGAFSAALLHIILHSLYKAYAFLARGDVLITSDAARNPASPWPAPKPLSRVAQSTVRFAFIATLFVVLSWGLMSVLGHSPTTKPGGHLLGGILGVVLARRLCLLIPTASLRTVGWATAGNVVLLAGYAISLSFVDRIVKADGLITESLVATNGWVVAAIGVAFLALLASESVRGQRWLARWSAAAYVHSLNGWYVDAFVKRFARTLA